MQEPVAYGRLVDVARLGIGDLEGVITAVAIRFLFQVVMKIEDIVHQRVLEFLHVVLLALTCRKLLPCGEQVFERNDIFIGMNELNPSRPTPPPHESCLSLSMQ